MGPATSAASAGSARLEPRTQEFVGDDMEREQILAALRAANWVLGGPRGAAARLAMKRTTLQSKMKKLGISNRPSVQMRDGKPLVTDGPFAETREQLGG
jgi:hypothetical protein